MSLSRRVHSGAGVSLYKRDHGGDFSLVELSLVGLEFEPGEEFFTTTFDLADESACISFAASASASSFTAAALDY